MVRRSFLQHYQYVFILCCLALLAPWSRADGLADLRKTLKQIQPSNPTSMPITIDVQFKLFGHTGEDDELIEREGLIDVRLEDGAKGMHIIYPADALALLHREELAKIADENVKNSALNAVGEFDYWEWRELMYPAAQLELALERYTFLGEQGDTYAGQPARLLTFSLPMEKIDKKYRKYVKKYHHRFTLWIDDKGTPLASASTETGSGRVFLVIGFQFQNTVSMTYQQQGSRLIGVRREVKEETWGAAMQAHRHFISTVTHVEFSTPKKISQ